MNATSHPMNGEVTMGMLEHTLSPLSVSCPYSDPNCDDYDGLTRRERILLRPWLENLIDSGQVPGLEWIDRPKYVFKVPWKHRSKKSWSVEHSSVFLEWAKNTGRWREGDPEPNYAQLKTRLRCAFNKAPDIQEIKELHKTKCEDAYKVYRFVPKKESRFGNFKKKMLIPTSIKRRHCSWIGSGLKFQGIGRKLKQENALEPVSEIKMEPLCGSPDGYEGLSNNAPVHYDREVYPMDDEDRRPPSPCTSTSTSLRDETRYTMKYPKQQALSEYLPDDGPASYPNGTGSDQVRLQAFPDIAAELSRRAGNVEGIAQDGSFNSVGGCGRAPISNATYRRNYDEHQFQSTKFQGVDVNNPYGMVLRQSFQESDACTNQHSFSGVANQRRYPNAFLDNNATTAAGFATHRGSPSVQHLKFRSGCDKSYPVDDSMNMQRMYHHSPQRLNQERFNQEKFNQEKFNQEKFNQDRFNQERFNLSNVGQGFSMSSSYDNVKLQKSSLQLPQQPKGRDRDLPPENKPSPPSRTSDVSDLPMLSSISGRPPPSADCFYSERPALEPLASRASEHIETMSHVSCQDKGVEKIPDSCCSVPEGSELLHSQQDSHGMEMKNKVFQGQMPFLTPSKPAGPNVLDLTKKVKMAVAPFIAHKAQTMDMNNSDAAKRASSGSHLSSQNPFEKFSEHLNDPLTNAKVMDLIEWERRLIERERELLARERLMTHKEKQLRELELAFKLDHKVEMSNHGEYPPKRQNDTCQTSIRLDKSSSSVMKDDRNNDFRGAKSTCPQSSPPPLSPLRTFAYNDRPYRDSRWPRGCFKGDASSMTSSSSSDSDIYYSQLVQNNNLKYINRDLPALERAEATNSEKLRLNALFINNARNEYTNAVTLHGVTQDWNKFSPEVLVISKNKETYESNAPSDVEEETSRNQDQIAVADKSCSDEFVKVLPVVDSMNSEDVLHIAKLPDKIPDEKEIAASRENGDSSYSSYKSSSTSSATEKESASGKEDFHEEVWKRRMKWMSFQCLQNNALSQVKPTGSSGHWIWPDIGNLTGQRQEQSKLEEGD